MAVYSMLIGVTLIGLHAWSIITYSNFIDLCEYFYFSEDIGLCESLEIVHTTKTTANLLFSLGGRVAIDSLLICSGCFIVILNVCVAAKASSLVHKVA